MAKNGSLTRASKEKKDEFYTKITDIEKELKHYKEHFKEKTVFCNCDDPETSNFWKYFTLNFDYLELKKLTATHYETDHPSYKLELTRENGVVQSRLLQNGDFRSPECIEIMKESDIIVTNPPFSLFREYILQLIEYEKKFVVIGNQNAYTYKEIFVLIKNNQLWTGFNCGDMEFVVPDYYEPRATRFRMDENGVKYRSLGNISWFTNLDITKRHEDILLYRSYNETDYKKYDAYDAINVNAVKDIPVNYKGRMGVPITFIDKYNPDQFEILGIDRYIEDNPKPGYRFTINGKETYARIIVRLKGEEE